MSEKVEEGVVLPMSERMAIDETIGGGGGLVLWVMI